MGNVHESRMGSVCFAAHVLGPTGIQIDNFPVLELGSIVGIQLRTPLAVKRRRGAHLKVGRSHMHAPGVSYAGRTTKYRARIVRTLEEVARLVSGRLDVGLCFYG